MSLTNLGEHSRYWPWIKAIANHLTIPGTKIGLETLTTLQDDLTQDQFREKVKAMLEVMYQRTEAILERLQAEDQIAIEAGALRIVSEDLAEELYLKQLADKFFYADFKGIEQQSRFVSLPLDDIFVDLKATPEDRETTLRDKERELRAQLEDADEEHSLDLLRALEELEVKGSDEKTGGEARPADELLRASGPVVLLGGPGSGKTTLVKRLARSCALGPAVLRQRYPRMPWCFPVVLPITQFATERAGRRLLDYLEAVTRERGGEALLARHRQHWQAGRVLLLLDGLDEVAETAHRIASARAVDEALGSSGGNRVLVSSRRVGYAICRLATPARHFILAPFSRQDITTFVEHWHLAYEKAAHEDKADLAGARKAADALNSELQKHASVASLATNPLMLTIIALIKHQNVILPHRRVELYEVALNTLLRSWNLARSLASRSPGEDPRIEQTRAVWSHVAFWMLDEANRDVGRDRLHAKLVEVLTTDFDKTEYDALAIAESYLASAAETSGLLEARGPNTFGFIHQSFQEYLAALYLARPSSKALKKISRLCHDPRWTEVIRLAVGHLSIALGERETVGEIVDSLLAAADPLEPFLCTSLRLAFGCLADQVDLRQVQVDAVLVAATERIIQTTYSDTRKSIVAALEAVESAPGTNAQAKLLELVSAPAWRTRMEAVRLIGISPCLSADILYRLRTVLQTDRDPDVRAYAAWALWRQGRSSRNSAQAIAYGLNSHYTRMSRLPDDALLRVFVTLLTDLDWAVRSTATEVLENWGPQEMALPPLVKLLEAADADVRYRAARVLGNWGRKETAVLSLVKLLEAPNANVRYRAARMLGEWGQQETALSTLVKLLADPYAAVRCRAAQALGEWGKKETALPALVELLADPNPTVRSRAAEVLGKWGPQEMALSPLLNLLEDPDATVRSRAAQALRNWGPRETALRVLLKLLADQATFVRYHATEVLGEWGPQETVLTPLVRLLADSDPDVRYRATLVLSKWGPQAKALPILVKLLADPVAYVSCQAAATLGSWDQKETTVPALVKLLEAPNANMRYRAAELLGKWGLQEKALPVVIKLLVPPDNSLRYRAAELLGKWGLQESAVTAFVLKQLAGKADPAVVTLLHQSGPATGKRVSGEARATLAALLHPQNNDSTEVKQLRGILHGWVWRTLATTAS
jgi:HEAT repeat protein